MFLAKKILSVLLLPPLAPLLLVFAGLLLIGWKPRLGRVLAWTGALAAALLASPFVANALLAPLEDIPPPTPKAVKSASAIVILAGGKSGHAPEYGGETVNRLTLERLRYGARLARQSGLPVLVTGGAPSEGTPEAVLMRQTLEQDFKVPVRWVEANSMDTEENARNSAAILKTAGIRRVVLVSHAAHLRRAQAEFAAAGLETVLAPTGFLGKHAEGVESAGEFLPTIKAAYAGWYACHEWLGLLAWRLKAALGFAG